MLFDPWPRPWGQGHTNIAQYPLHHFFYPPTKFEFATFQEEMQIQEIHYLAFGLADMVTRIVAQYSLQYVLCTCKV